MTIRKKTIWRWEAALDGVARLLDLGGVYGSRTRALSDEDAMRADWQAVGDDLRRAIGEHEAGVTVKASW